MTTVTVNKTETTVTRLESVNIVQAEVGETTVTKEEATTTVKLGDVETNVIKQEAITQVKVGETDTRVVTQAKQGLPGTPGSSASTAILTAGENLSALRVVSTNDAGEAVYADKDSNSLVKRITGVTTTAALVTQTVTVQSYGLLEDNSWNWNMSGDVTLFLGDGGVITQGPPAGTITARIGHAVSPTEIFIKPGEPVINA